MSGQGTSAREQGVPAPAPGPDAQAFLGSQRAAIELDLMEKRHRWLLTPRSQTVVFGEGHEAEQTFRGNEQLPFRGVAIMNPTARAVHVAFGPGGAASSALVCPPYSALIWPATYSVLSLAVASSAAAGAPEAIEVLELFDPPPLPSTAPYGAPALASSPELLIAAGSTLTNTTSNALRIVSMFKEVTTAAGQKGGIHCRLLIPSGSPHRHLWVYNGREQPAEKAIEHVFRVGADRAELALSGEETVFMEELPPDLLLMPGWELLFAYVGTGSEGESTISYQEEEL